MSDTRGVFSLKLVYNKKIRDEWISLNDVWISPSVSHTGYFGGGTPGPFSTMDKVTYSTDTTAQVPGAPLSVPRGYFAATGNSTAGYFGGGSVFSTMDKVTYS